MIQSAEIHPNFTEALADLAALDVNEDTRLGTAFGVIGARSNARWWIVPLSDRRQASSGLDLFQSISAPARAIKAGARTLCWLGLQNLVFRQRLHLNGTADLAASFPGGAADCAIFTGTDGPHRKTTLQFTDARGGILGYGKLSRVTTVTCWIEAEARILNEVAGLCLTSADTPRTLDLYQRGGAVLLLTDSLKGKGFTVPSMLGPAHIAFLTELSARTKGGNWQKHIAELRKKLTAVTAVMNSEWQCRMARALEQLNNGKELPLSLAHGDFTPWNSFMGERFYVFDWEYAGRKALGHDIVHFIFATNPKAEATALIELFLVSLATHLPTLTSEAADQALLAYLCDHTLLFARREIEGLSRIDGWDGAPRIAEVMDCLVSTRK